MRRLLWLLCLASVSVCTAAGAESLHDESVDGDLSTDSSSYTQIEVLAGANTITVQTGPSATDIADYFELVFDDKRLALERIELLAIELGADNTGTRFSACLGPGDDCLPFNGIAEILMDDSLEGADLLALLEDQAPGQLTNFFRIGESTGPSMTVLTVVAPEPAAAWQLAAMLVALEFLAFRRSREKQAATPGG